MIDTKQGAREVYYNYFSPPPPLTFIVSSSKIIYISYYLLLSPRDSGEGYINSAVRLSVRPSVTLSCLRDNLSKRMDLNNFLHVACNYLYLGWVLTWKYLKQGFWGKILVFG